MQWAYNSHSGLHSKEIEKKSKKFGEEFKRQGKGSILTYFQTISPRFYPPVGQRVGREKTHLRFQNKIDAKKPDSRKNLFTGIPTQSPTKWVCVGEEKQESGRMAIFA